MRQRSGRVPPRRSASLWRSRLPCGRCCGIAGASRGSITTSEERNEMLPIDMSLLAGWLPQQRWFGGKGAAIASVRDVDRAQIFPGLILATVEVSYRERRPPERYALALKPWTGTPGLADALDDDAAPGLLGIGRE